MHRKRNVYILRSTYIFQSKNLIFSNQLTSRTKKKKEKISYKNYIDSLEISSKIPTEIPAIRSPLQQTTLKTETLAFSRAKRDR